MQQIKTDVLISGAGPSGLMLACLLSRQGTDFIIIDKASEKTMNSGALVIHAASMEIIRSLDLFDEVLFESTTVNNAKFQISEGKEYLFDISVPDKINSSSPSLILIEQFKLEKILISYLSRAGIKVLSGISLQAVINASGYISSTIIDKYGSEGSIISRYVVGADGKDSKVREFGDFAFKKLRHQNPVFIIDFEGHADETPGEISFSFSDKGSFGLFPLKSGYFRLDGALPGTFKNDSRIVFEDIKDYLPTRIRISKVRWFSVFYSNYLLCDNFRSGNIFLIGDAAHTHSPVGGQGLNSGFQDALNLGWKLSYVIKGLMHENLLDTYTSERRRAVKKIMDRSDFLFRHITDFRKMHLKARLAITPVIISLASKLFNSERIRIQVIRGISQLWIRYYSRLIDASSGWRIGQTGTLFRFRDLKNCSGFYNNYRLLILSKRDSKPNHPDLSPFPLDIIQLNDIDTSNRLLKGMNIKTHSFILLRPDNFIAMVKDEADAESITKYFKDLIQ